jgi:hypothetical protein
MKNKKLTYILIPLVAVVWGLIFYKIYLQVNGSDKDVQPFAVMAGNAVSVVPDTIHLKLNYRDPFLSYSFNRERIKSPVFGAFLQANIPGNTKPEFIWPSIKYDGMIVNSKTKRKTGLLNFETKNYLVKEGDNVNGYKVIKLFADSVYIGYSKHKKTFIR